MKKLLAKIRNKRLKGNVSLLVILILLASSVIALLSISQIQHLITYWNMTYNYFRAFYLAKAWTELGLTEVYYREAWFENTINSWDAIVSWNFTGANSGFNTYFTMNISWNFQHLTNDVRYTNECDVGNRITLWAWEWIMLSLFKDVTTGCTNTILTGYSNIKKMGNDVIQNIEMENTEWSWWTIRYFTFWLFDYNTGWDMNNITVKTWDNLNIFLKNVFSGAMKNFGSGSEHAYLTIKNPWTWSETVSFCIHDKESKRKENKVIPYSNSLITVRGNYADMEVWLQSVVEKEVPFWAMDVLWIY